MTDRRDDAAKPASPPNRNIPLFLAVAAAITGVMTVVGIAGGAPDYLVTVLFLVLTAAAVDGFVRGRVTGRHSDAYLMVFAALAAVLGLALLAVGAVIGGVVLLVVGAGAGVVLLIDRRRRAAQPEATLPEA